MEKRVRFVQRAVGRGETQLAAVAAKLESVRIRQPGGVPEKPAIVDLGAWSGTAWMRR
jgi:hypothetical protein